MFVQLPATFLGLAGYRVNPRNKLFRNVVVANTVVGFLYMHIEYEALHHHLVRRFRNSCKIVTHSRSQCGIQRIGSPRTFCGRVDLWELFSRVASTDCTRGRIVARCTCNVSHTIGTRQIYIVSCGRFLWVLAFSQLFANGYQKKQFL